MNGMDERGSRPTTHDADKIYSIVLPIIVTGVNGMDGLII